MRYRISVQAQQDLENIWLYTFDKWSLEQADRYIRLILDEIEYISVNQNSGIDCGRVRKNYRFSKVKSHLIFYRQNPNQNLIDIIRILHEKMDLDSRLIQ